VCNCTIPAEGQQVGAAGTANRCRRVSSFGGGSGTRQEAVGTNVPTENHAVIVTRGPWPEFPQLCEYGLRRPPKGGLVSPVRADEIETAIAFLRRFKPTKRGTYNSYFLKHEAERWGRRNGMSAYVSNGALIAAALSLGLAIDEYLNCWPTSPNAKIGISKRDFNKYVREERERHVG
jgi:hypothetical protein